MSATASATMRAQQIGAIAALAPHHLVTNLTTILCTIQSQQLFDNADETLTIAIKNLSDKITHTTAINATVSDTFALLKMLSAVIAAASPVLVKQCHTDWLRLCSQSAKLYNEPLTQSLSMQCRTLTLCQCQGVGELRHPLIGQSRPVLVADLITAITALSANTDSAITIAPIIVRNIASLQRLLTVFGSDLKHDFATLSEMFVSLLIHTSESVRHSAITALNHLLIVQSTLTASQSQRQQRQQQQQKLQRESHDAADDDADRNTSSTPPATAESDSPYTHFIDRAIRTLRLMIDEMREVSGEKVTASKVRASDVLSWPALSGDASTRVSQIKERTTVISKLLQHALNPTLPAASVATAGQSAMLVLPVVSLMQTLTLALQIECQSNAVNYATVSPLTPAHLSLLLPSLYRDAMTVFAAIYQRHGASVLVLAQSSRVVSLIQEMHHRLSNIQSLTSLFSSFYQWLSSLLTAPLAPTLLASLLTSSLLDKLLTHSELSCTIRKQHSQHTAHQRAQAQLKSHGKRKASDIDTASVSLSPLTIATSEALSVSALAAVSVMLNYNGTLLAAETRIKVDKSLVLVLLAMVGNPQPPVPAPVRRAVFEAIIASLQSPVNAAPTSHIPPLLVFVLPEIEWFGINDEDSEVRALCRQASRLCDWVRSEREGVNVGRRKRRIDNWNQQQPAEVVDLLVRVEEHAAAMMSAQVSAVNKQARAEAPVSVSINSALPMPSLASTSPFASSMSPVHVTANVGDADEKTAETNAVEAVSMEDEDDANEPTSASSAESDEDECGEAAEAVDDIPPATAISAASEAAAGDAGSADELEMELNADAEPDDEDRG